MIKNKKGFSLAEMLVTIALIGVILAIAVPSITIISKSTKQRTLTAKKQVIIAAAEKYGKRGSNANNYKYQIETSVQNLLAYGLIEADIEAGEENCTESDYPMGCVIDPTNNTIINNIPVYILRNKSITIAKWGPTDLPNSNLEVVLYSNYGSNTPETITIDREFSIGDTYDYHFDSFSRTDYTMVGWAKSSDSKKNEVTKEENEYSDEITITSAKTSVTYYAQTKKELTATFNKNGATSISATSKTCDVWNSATSCKITNIPTITRSGWDIIGWGTSANSKSSSLTPGSLEAAIDSDKTYYAQTKKTLTATFDKNGATSISEASKTCDMWNNDTSCNITNIPTITRSGWQIIGWGTSANSKSSSLTPGSSEAAINSNITYYAQTKKILTATFNKNGADSISETSITCNIWNNDTSCNITNFPSIQREGYTILGWHTYQYSHEALSNYTLTENTPTKNFYAITYKEIYAAFFGRDGITLTPSNTNQTIYDSFIMEKCLKWNAYTSCGVRTPYITPASGYNVVGWSDDYYATSSQYSVNSLISITDSINFYAIQSKDTTITCKSLTGTPTGCYSNNSVSVMSTCNDVNTDPAECVLNTCQTTSGVTSITYNINYQIYASSNNIGEHLYTGCYTSITRTDTEQNFSCNSNCNVYNSSCYCGECSSELKNILIGSGSHTINESTCSGKSWDTGGVNNVHYNSCSTCNSTILLKQLSYYGYFDGDGDDPTDYWERKKYTTMIPRECTLSKNLNSSAIVTTSYGYTRYPIITVTSGTCPAGYTEYNG